MGNGHATCTLTSPEKEYFETITHFNGTEIALFHSHFLEVCGPNRKDGLIDRKDFQASLGFVLQESLLADLIFEHIDDNKDGLISFVEFLRGLSILSSKGTLQEKIQFSFSIYDLDKDGKISKPDLTQILQAATSENNIIMNDLQIQQVITRTFEEADLDHDGYISIDEYRDMVHKNKSILNHITINMSGVLGESKQSLRTLFQTSSEEYFIENNS